MQSRKTYGVKILQHIFKFFDLYGQNVNLYINKKPKFYSACSGIISMGVIVIIIFTFIGFIDSWLNNEKMTAIQSSFSYSAMELLSKNQNYEYDFNYKNYYIYWSFWAALPNGTTLVVKDLIKYYTYNVTYLNENYIPSRLETEPCKIDQQDVFLGLDEAIRESDSGKIAINRICIKDNFKMGLFPNKDISFVFEPEMYFSLYQCVNSTNNNNSCAPQEEIDEIIKYTTVQSTIPSTLFDFKNYKKPQKNIYQYHYTKLEKSMLKYYTNYMITTSLYLDNGLINDDYSHQSTNFNPNLDYDPKFRAADEPLYVLDCLLDLSFQDYYLRNEKLNEIAGNLGGLINAIFLLGKLLCITYNSIYLKFKIINSTFSHSNKTHPDVFQKGIVKVGISKGSITAKIARNFSYCSYLFPSKDVRKFYEKGAKHLHEYLDIRKIIKRLQDLDKLKMILLNDDQRRLFEHIPKPQIIDMGSPFSMESINRYKARAKTRKATKNIPNTMKSLAEDKDPINKRILKCLDGNLNLNYEQNDNEGNK